MSLGVLLITNNSNICRIITTFLDEKDLLVKKCTDEDNYIKEIQEEQPDIIVIDDETVNIQAQDILKEIRRKFPHILLLVIVKNDDLEYINKFLEIPVDDFITKPVDPSILYLRIKNLFREYIKDKEILKNGKLIIDNAKKQVFFNKKEIDVSPKEYRLLRYMMENKGRVLSRTAILDHVWGYDSYVIDRNVDVYIGYLRKKIGEKEKYIKTVPSFGYMMEDKD